MTAVVWVLTYWLTMVMGGGPRIEAQVVLPTQDVCLSTARALHSMNLGDGFIILAGDCIAQERP